MKLFIYLILLLGLFGCQSNDVSAKPQKWKEISISQLRKKVENSGSSSFWTYFGSDSFYHYFQRSPNGFVVGCSSSYFYCKVLKSDLLNVCKIDEFNESSNSKVLRIFSISNDGGRKFTHSIYTGTYDPYPSFDFDSLINPKPKP